MTAVSSTLGASLRDPDPSGAPSVLDMSTYRLQHYLSGSARLISAPHRLLYLRAEYA
jgi:hypothetical protein